MSNFVHLHLHSQYSVLDGAIKIQDLLGKVKESGQDTVAITDHGNMHGAIEFYTAARQAKVKPIIGCEVYLTTGSRHDKRPKSQGGAPTHHLTLLAKDKTGYVNLCRLVSLAYLEGFYFKPRIDFELLSEHNAGLICLSGCLSGELSASASLDDVKAGREVARKHLEIFGDRYYLEVQPHAFQPQQKLNAFVREIGTELGIPIVATNDCHYLSDGDTYAQEVLMCISTGKLITDEDRLTHHDAKLHLKTAEEMLAELPGFEEAVRNSVRIAESCNVEFDFSTYHMPQFKPSGEVTLEEHFSRTAREGLEARLKAYQATNHKIDETLAQKYAQQLETEIECIIRMGFAGYFLVVSDFVLWAKHNGIPVGPGRGSAAGSLVAYALSITEIDPIFHNLLFERFLNPERISLPDIDVDFCFNGRDRVIEYVRSRYGTDKVAQIVTFGTLKAKAAIKDVGRVLGLSYAETDRVAKLIPAPRQGFDYPLTEALKMEKRLKDYAEGEGKQLIELALKLEGLTRHTSTHAAGIVVADRPVMDLLPLMIDKDDLVVTQYSMNWVEKIGLVKFDFLGLKTLSVLKSAVDMIRDAKKIDVDLDALPLDDERTFRLISQGRTIGVFQLESSGITDMVGRLKPTCFEDLVAVLALYRPGPLDAGMVDHFINRKHGREPVRYMHAVLEPILRDTYGIIVYQEQIMQIARDMGGYTLGEADILRRAMGKKKPEEMAEQRKVFLAGASKKGFAPALATEVFDQMETFARYGFNRSHSVAYAMISLQTAYLKAHYPLYFMASLMTFEMDDTDKTLKNLGECREMGIVVLPPDVNRSDAGFCVVGDSILFGLAAIKGVGSKVVEMLREERNANGPFTSLLNFCERLDSHLVNRRTIENFIKAGAFDGFGIARAELFERVEMVMKRAQVKRANKSSLQIGLFETGKSENEAEMMSRPLLPEWPKNMRLSHEREALGFYLSGHPLEKFSAELERLGSARIDTLKSSSDGAQVITSGVVTFLKLRNTKKGDRYATFVLEDLMSTIEVIVWPDVYNNVHAILGGEEPVLVTGRLDVTDERRTLVATNVESAIALRDRTAKEAIVRLDIAACSDAALNELKAILLKNRGSCPVKIILRKSAECEAIVSLPAEMTVELSERLCNQVEALFGVHAVTFR